MDRRHGGLRAATASVILLVLSACASEPASPADQLRALLEQTEAAAEQQDLEAFEAILSESYSDERGNSKQAVVRLVNAHFLQNRSIHLFTRTDSLAFADSARATASVLVAMTGRPIEDAGALALARATIYRFAFTFVDEGHGAWKLTHATWRRASAEDFF